jgi:hypothetical protein
VSNLTSKSQLILRNLDLVLVSSDGDDVEEYSSTGHGPQGMFFCYTPSCWVPPVWYTTTLHHLTLWTIHAAVKKSVKTLSYFNEQ